MSEINEVYSKEEIEEMRENFTDEQIFNYLDEKGGEPIHQDKAIISKTICHCGKSHKLYYFFNTHLFKCFTDCDETWDIFSLTQKIHESNGEPCSLTMAINEVRSFFGLEEKMQETFDSIYLKEQKSILNRYNKINKIEPKKKEVHYEECNCGWLDRLPQPRFANWEREGILPEICCRNNIRYNPSSEAIVIPHYNKDGVLLGVRERTLIKDNEKYGKYRPAYVGGQLYNHPLGLNLYNLNNSKKQINIAKKAIVFEGEKSTLLYASYFGADSDISVASCGSSFIQQQFDLLIQEGAEEIIIAFDRQFKELGDEEWKRWTKKLTNINTKYSNKCLISFVFDKWEMLDYKMSPLDNGKEVFLELFENRIIL